MNQFQILQAQPLGREPGSQGGRARIGQHAPHLRFQGFVAAQRTFPRQRHELVVGRRPPEEEGQPRGQVDIVDSERLARLDAGRRLLHAEHEVRARQDGRQGGADARLEAALVLAGAVEGHERGHVALEQRPAVRLARQPGEDVAGAALAFPGRLGTTAEDALPAGRLRDSGRFVRPADHQVPKVRKQGQTVAADAGVTVRQRPFVGRHEIFHRPLGALDERRGHPLRPGAHEDRIRAHGDAFRIGNVHPLVHVQQRHPLAVDRDFELLEARDLAEEALARGGVLEDDAELVGAVRGEVVHHAHAAAGAVGRPLDPLPLGDIAGHRVGPLGGLGAWVADGQAADLVGRVHVCVEERGREQLRLGDVVEVRALGVGRQVVAGVDAQVQEVLDRPRVLGLVEPLEGAPAGVGGRARGRIHPALQFLHQRDQGVAHGPGHSGGRHHPGTQLEDHLLRGLGPRRRLLHVEPGEREVAGQKRVVVAHLAVALHHTGERGRRHPNAGGTRSDRPPGHGGTRGREAPGPPVGMGIHIGGMGNHTGRCATSPVHRGLGARKDAQVDPEKAQQSDSRDVLHRAPPVGCRRVFSRTGSCCCSGNRVTPAARSHPGRAWCADRARWPCRRSSGRCG